MDCLDLRGCLRSSISITKADVAAFCLDPFDHIFEQDGGKVSLFHAHAMIPDVNNISYLAIESGQHHTIGVSVTMYVDSKTT